MKYEVVIKEISTIGKERGVKSVGKVVARPKRRTGSKKRGQGENEKRHPHTVTACNTRRPGRDDRWARRARLCGEKTRPAGLSRLPSNGGRGRFH